MTREEFLKKFTDICEDRGISIPSKKYAQQISNAFIDTIQDSLVAGDTVKWIGFGSFSPVVRKEKTGRNPQTGEQIIIPSRVRVKFNPGKTLISKLND